MHSILSSQLVSLVNTVSQPQQPRIIQHSGLADSVDAIRHSIYRTMLLVRAPMDLSEIEDACETPKGHARGHIKALMKQGLVRPAKGKFIAVSN